MMKKLLAMALTISLAFSMIACGSKPTEQSPAEEQNSPESLSPQPTTEEESKVSVWINSSNEDTANQLRTRFAEMYPDVQIEWGFYPMEDLKTQSRLAVNSGTAPDIFVTNSGSLFDDFCNSGALMDITDIVTEMNLLDRLSNSDYILPYTKEGRYYGFPTSPLTTWQTLYINRDLFKQAGIEKDPTTVEELIEVSDKLNAAGIAPLALGDKDGWPAVILMGDFFAQQVSDSSIIKDIRTGKDKFTENEIIKKSFDTVIKLGQAGVFMPGFASQDQNSAIQTFAAGKTAMLYNGSWWVSSTDGIENLGFEADVIKLPTVDGITEAKSVQMSSDMGFVVSKDAKNMDGVKAVIDFLTCEETAVENAKSDRAFSLYPNTIEKVDLDPLFQTEPISSQFDKPALYPFFDWVFPTPVTEVLKPLLQQGVAGEVTTEEAMAKLQEVMDQNLDTP